MRSTLETARELGDHGSPTSRTFWFVAIMLLAIHAALLACSAARNSPTWDETGHLVAGLSHWRFGRFDLYRVNPPLVRSVAVIPLHFLDVDVDWSRYDASVGARSEQQIRIGLIESQGERLFYWHTVARWGCIPLSLLGGAMCLLWASELYGRIAGLLAATLWCFCPNILGHASLITPDVGAAALGVTAAYAFWRWLQRPAFGRTLLAGIALGLAELSKSTWTALFVLWPLIWLVYRIGHGASESRPRWLGELAQLTLIVLLALYFLNAGYGFEGSLEPLGKYRFVSRALSAEVYKLDDRIEGGNRFLDTCVENLPVPLPRNYVMGIDLQRWDFERKMWSYLDGEWRMGGWWYYYLYALAIKVPLGTWMLILLALLAGAFRTGYASAWRDELVLLAPLAVVLILVSSQTGFNHHLRYVLPIFPFAFLWTSKVARVVERRNWRLGALAALALAWSVGSSLWVYPHSLSYFNELVGGPKEGHWHLDNSNIDWGQDLLYLKRWYDEHPEARPLGVSYYIPYISPKVAGIEHFAPPRGPTAPAHANSDAVGPLPGWYAVSVNHLHDPNLNYGYFLRFEPVDRIGYSMNIYHITFDEANCVRQEMGLPQLAPPPDHD